METPTGKLKLDKITFVAVRDEEQRIEKVARLFLGLKYKEEPARKADCMRKEAR